MGRRLERSLHLPEGELRPTLAAAAAMAGILLAYGLLKPLRDAHFASDPAASSWLWTATFAGAVGIQPLWARAAGRLERGPLLALLFRGAALLALLLGGTFLLLDPESSGTTRLWLGRVFYVGVSVANLLLVSVAWSSLADGERASGARRSFGLVAAGASLGAIGGSAGVALLGEVARPGTLLLAAAVLLELALRLLRQAGANPHGRAGRAVTLEGLALVLRSARLRRLAGYVLVFTMGSTWLYFTAGRLVGEQLASEGERVEFYARLHLVTNLVTLLAQVLLSGLVMSRLGLTTALALLPAVSIVGLGLLASQPTLGVLFGVHVVMTSTRYAFARPGREAALVGADPAELLQAKPAIDTAAYRGGDLGSAWAFQLVTTWAAPALAPVLWVALPVQALGLYFARSLGSTARS